ncbi:MAG: S8 family serine peptidase [Myxococcota bacterium]|nr:S8 family serine peptidase [Myxococcota bacterium]
MYLSLSIAVLLGADLVRVDVPDHPNAIATSRHGSTLAEPPADGTPWRPAPVPEPTSTPPHESIGREARAAMNVDAWHTAGHRGAGVKIAVFDIQWFGRELNSSLADAPSHDCFAHRSCALPIDTITPQFAFETGGHGIACAEVVRAVAPEAELHLVRVNGLTALENAVDWAVTEGIDIVSMSMSFFNESFYDGTGSIADAMDVLSAGGTLMVASAGNYARQHHRGHLTDDDRNTLHEFEDGSETLAVYLTEGTPRISVIWDEYGACGTTDIDAYLYNQDGDLVGRSTRTQRADAQGCFPAETITASVQDDGWHELTLHHVRGPRGVEFNVLTRSGHLAQPHAEGSVTDPGSHPSVFTVGAVDATGYRFNPVERFSSQGPTPSGLTKPDIVGPDGLTTTVYGPGRFYGTSASTPSVAGAVAVLMSADPTLSPRQAAQQLSMHAINEGPHWMADGVDVGSGKARLPSVSDAAIGCSHRMALAPFLAWMPVAHRRRRRDRIRDDPATAPVTAGPTPISPPKAAIHR